MVEKMVNRRFYFSGVEYTVEVPVPDLERDPDSGRALGKSYAEKNENLDKFLSELIFPQYTRSMRNAISAYKSSKLPEKFLHGQRVKITPLPMMTDDVRGYYNISRDIICLDNDSFSIGLSSGCGNFLYGHESGHRILEIKKRDKDEALAEVSSILSISNTIIITELLCDAFGYLICHGDRTRFDVLPDILSDKKEGIALVALKLAWKC